MIFIHKSSSPPELTKLKQEAEAQGLSDRDAYDLLRNPLKSQVREALLQEQGHLCAYCMRKLPDTRSETTDSNFSGVYIEHWLPRSSKTSTRHNHGLDYNNMLAVCSGNEKAPEASGKRKRRFLTCDKRRRDQELHVNPLNPETLSTIFYSEDGKIGAGDPIIQHDLTEVLNLNCESDAVTLPQSRKQALDAIQAEVYARGGDILANCQAMLSHIEGERDPKTAYIGIGIWWLKKQIAAMQRNKAR